MRWLTVRVPGSDFSVLLERPGPPAHDEATAERVRNLVTQSALGLALIQKVDDARAAYDQVVAKGVGVVQEPTDMPYGVDFGFRDPFGNQIRVTQPSGATNEELQRAFDATRA